MVNVTKRKTKRYLNEVRTWVVNDAKWKNAIEYCKDRDMDIVKVHSRYFRPSEVDSLLGDATKAMEVLGWKPEISFEELVRDMCTHES